jgi:putative flippase GtrA
MQKRLVRFAAVGVFNTLFNLLLFNVFIFAFGLHVTLSNIISILISIAISFILNVKLVFIKYDLRNLHTTFVKFLAVTLVSQLVIQQLVLLFFLDVFQFPGHLVNDIARHLPGLQDLSRRFYELNTAKILAVGVSLIANFLAYERVVFSSKREEDSKEPVS